MDTLLRQAGAVVTCAKNSGGNGYRFSATVMPVNPTGNNHPVAATSILLAWLGQTDLNAAGGDPQAGLGPIAQAAGFRNFARIVLLSDYPEDRTQGYLDWLSARTRAELVVRPVRLSSPMHFGEIYQAARRALSELTAPTPAPAVTIHLSPGTPAMAAVWIILAKTRFPAELIQSSAAHGVQVATVPFDLAAEFLPDVLHQADRRLGELSAGKPPARADPIRGCARPSCQLVSWPAPRNLR